LPAFLMVNGQSPCSEAQYQQIMKCNALSMDTEWANLLVGGDKYIAEKQNLARDCYKQQHCNVTLDFKQDWWAGYERPIQHAAQVFFKVINTASSSFVSCVVQNIFDNFHGRVDQCMSTKFGVTFPKVSQVPIPMPHDHLFLPDRVVFRTYIYDRILSLVKTKDCPKQRYPTEICIVDDNGVNNKCRDEHMDKNSLCYKALPLMCERVSGCIEEVIPIADADLSKLFTGDVATLVSKCEQEAQKIRGTRDPQYSREYVHEVIEVASKIRLHAHEAAHLNQLLFDIFRAFLDYGAAFC